MAKRKTAKRILVIDVGGTHVKLLATGHRTPIKIPSGPGMTAAQMVRLVKDATATWKYDVIAMGYPGVVRHDRAVTEPRHLARGWVGVNFSRVFGRPVRMVNDAAMQAFGSYRRGRLLFLGLGTGLGTALIVDGVIEPMEIGHLPYKNGLSYEDYIGEEGLERHGKKKWRRHVIDIVTLFRQALQVDDVVLGGGNARKLKTAPRGTRLGSNSHAFTGGFKMWADGGAKRPDAGRRTQ